MLSENYDSFEIGKDCLNAEMKRARIEHKAKLLEGKPETDTDILTKAEKKYFGPVDPGPLSD